VTRRPPASVWIAAVLVMAYGVVLLGEGIVLLANYAQGGTAAAPHLDATGLRGLQFVGIALCVIALLFGLAGVMFLRRGSPLLFVIPLALIFLGGSIGEIVDVTGGSDLTGNLIGLGILLLAIVPIVLAYIPPSRAWKIRSTQQ
jgi:hypothetical protein